MEVNAQRVIDKYIKALSEMTERAIIAETAVEELNLELQKLKADIPDEPQPGVNE